MSKSAVGMDQRLFVHLHEGECDRSPKAFRFVNGILFDSVSRAQGKKEFFLFDTGPGPRGRGFPEKLPEERPKFELNPGYDIYRLGRGRGSPLWLMSDRMRDICMEIDPDAFDWLEAEATSRSWSGARRYWIADVKRILDVVDRERTKVQISEGDPAEFHILGKVYFMNVPPNVHIFRPLGAEHNIFVDDEFKRRVSEVNGRAFYYQPTVW
jgi:hypothetical protein